VKDCVSGSTFVIRLRNQVIFFSTWPSINVTSVLGVDRSNNSLSSKHVYYVTILKERNKRERENKTAAGSISIWMADKKSLCRRLPLRAPQDFEAAPVETTGNRFIRSSLLKPRADEKANGQTWVPIFLIHAVIPEATRCPHIYGWSMTQIAESGKQAQFWSSMEPKAGTLSVRRILRSFWTYVIPPLGHLP